MLDVSTALNGAARPAPAVRPALRRALVVGAGGVLGAAVMEQLLGGGRFAHVAAAITRPMSAAVRGFVGIDVSDAEALSSFGADTALIVFDRERGAIGQGREAALLRAEPAQLVEHAERLHAAGVCTLVVVVPHAAGLLPHALQQGLASLDEAALAALGFEHLAFMRMARGMGGDTSALAAPQRLARWMLSQLHWMVPQREQPVRPETVAKVAAALAAQLHEAAHGTRVVPAALLWQAAQQLDAGSVVRAWLHPAVAA